MTWTGPFQVRKLLERCADDARVRPPEDKGVYIVTVKSWHGHPKAGSGVLYVGGNTGSSERFRTRIGDLLADMLGFFGDSTGHHSGGQSLWRWCQKNGVHPLDLYLGWKANVRCKRCEEVSLYAEFSPALNRNRPSKCREHV